MNIGRIMTLALAGLAYTQIEAADLQEFIDGEVAQNKKNITVPAGEYRISETLNLSRLKDVKINAENVTLIMTETRTALQLDKCSNLEINGLTVDYDPLPFTQGTITDVKPGRLEFSVHAGYPRLDKNSAVGRGHIFDAKSRKWKKGVGDMYGKTQILSPDKGVFTTHVSTDHISIGDYIVLNKRKAAGIYFRNLCRNISFKNFTILTAPGIGIIGRFGLGNDYFNVVIKRGPAPKGATEPRLMSTTADGLNFAYTRNGPVLDQCDFSYMGDDGVNFHSVAFPVIRLLDKKTIITARPYKREGFPEVVKTGDHLRLLNKGNYAIKAESEISRIETASEELISGETIRDLFPFSVHKKNFQYTVYKVHCKSDITGVAEGDFFDIPAISASGFKIINSKFHDHRARGLRIMASDGIIKNNSFEYLKQSAISMGGEYGYWREAGWVHNLVVENNKISNVGEGTAVRKPDSYTPGAICTFVRLRDYKNCPSGNTDIKIINNTIKGCPVSGIFINAAKAVTVSGNVISDVCYDKSARGGSDFGLNSTEKISVKNSSDIKIADNKTE